MLVGFEPEDESPLVFLRLRKGVRKSGLKVTAIAAFATTGTEKLERDAGGDGPRRRGGSPCRARSSHPAT